MEIKTVEERAMRQATMTAHFYLQEAVKHIDSVFGANYAKLHPELVTAFLKTCAADNHTMLIYDGIERIKTALHAIAESMENTN